MVLGKLLRIPWTQRRSSQSILKEINAKYSLEGLVDAEAGAPVFWISDANSQLIGKDPNAGKYRRQKMKRGQRMRWLDGITNSMGVNMGKFQDMVVDWEAWYPAVHDVAELDMIGD